MLLICEEKKCLLREKDVSSLCYFSLILMGCSVTHKP